MRRFLRDLHQHRHEIKFYEQAFSAGCIWTGFDKRGVRDDHPGLVRLLIRSKDEYPWLRRCPLEVVSGCSNISYAADAIGLNPQEVGRVVRAADQTLGGFTKEILALREDMIQALSEEGWRDVSEQDAEPAGVGCPVRPKSPAT